jgi:hypothetical protein
MGKSEGADHSQFTKILTIGLQSPTSNRKNGSQKHPRQGHITERPYENEPIELRRFVRRIDYSFGFHFAIQLFCSVEFGGEPATAFTGSRLAFDGITGRRFGMGLGFDARSPKRCKQGGGQGLV